LKVAFITHYSGLYGANRSLLNLIDGLKIYHVDCYVIIPEPGALVSELQSRNVPVEIVPIDYWIETKYLQDNWLKNRYRAIKRLRKNLRALPLLATHLKTWEIDLVYTNSAVTPVGALVAQKLCLPHIWHLREFIDLDYGFTLDWGKFIFNYFARKADALVAISQAIRSHYLKGLSPERMYVIYNGINKIAEFDRLYEIAHSQSILDRPYTFAIVGLLHPNKGQETAIKAFACLVEDFPNIRLLIVGTGPHKYQTFLKKLAERLKISKQVEFWGHIDDPYQAYLACDVLLMCSTNEGMGRVTVEAMSACRPVIGYDNAGTSEIIDREQTGLLYKNGYEELVVCMKQLLQNPTWTKQLGENAWRIARQNYCIEEYAQKIYEILSSLAPLKKSVQNDR
jgi:glycosyltransferase involved in cell wall biosynthesis